MIYFAIILVDWNEYHEQAGVEKVIQELASLYQRDIKNISLPSAV